MTLIDHGQAKNLWGLWAFVLPVAKQLGPIPKHAFKYKVYRSGKKKFPFQYAPVPPNPFCISSLD